MPPIRGVDQLRELMVIEEDERYSREYHEPDKRSIANAIQVFFKDGTQTDKVVCGVPDWAPPPPRRRYSHPGGQIQA